MKYRIIIVLCLLTNIVSSQTTSFYAKAKRLIGTFGVYHYKPIELNETTAVEVTNLFIEDLDRQGFVLTVKDCEALKVNSNQLFKQIELQNDDYINYAHAIYERALIAYDSILGIIAAKQLNFTDKDSITFLPYNSKASYSDNLKKHASRIERYIKSLCLDRVLNTDAYDKLTEEQFYSKAREFSKSIIKNFKRNATEQINDSYTITEAALLNALARRYDPHSNFFTDEQNKEFNKQLSAQVESFGFYFSENDNAIAEIGYIEPGGAAWMSNDINEGDVFISMLLGNTLFTNEDLNAAELQDKIENTHEKQMQLTIRKKNGLLKTIKLLKHKIASDENTVKGYILTANNTTVGYMALPSFYTDMENQTLPGCANDVAKELLKLENDSIQGLILDLRNNGGGSMLETINLAGIFIDEGPLFILKDRNRKPTLIKDINRGSIFKKPIIVIINEASASASELFSNIVKDYNLGAVVGQPSYGKGTAQNVWPLDTLLLYNKNKQTKTDYIKITNSRFYRLNCSTHQGHGVIPEIELPGTPGYSLYKESKEAYYLHPDSIVKRVVYTPHAVINRNALQQASAARVKSSPDFNAYKQYSDTVTAYINTTHRIPLTFKGFLKNKNQTDRIFTKFEEATRAKHNTITCRNNTFDKKLYEVNETVKEFNAKVMDGICKDMFINESFLILNDLINQQSK